ncbi:MAG: iron-containing alcohol dehydrogenase [Candidatus Eremiobacteraeota bacterium]|nr:iron-containing alcohol dehydrogenase [Candidatus Eremiobacteraeota bacterium]
MICCQHEHYAPTETGDYGFEVDGARIKYGRGVLAELGEAAKALGITRAGVFVDPHLRNFEFVATALGALRDAKVDAEIYTDITIEPTDVSFKKASAFATDGKFNGFISIGGGSTIDTAKAADLYATYPAEFMDYVNAPIGAGKPVPGPLRPHIACPTTSGTGSECTGIAIFDYLEMNAKTGIRARELRPALGVIDPNVTRTLPPMVVACSGFDVLSHALESYTALPFTERARVPKGVARPLSQGANPYSDVGCIAALSILGEHIVRAVKDPGDEIARERMMFAAMLAGIAFGNAGCHLPHGMSYAVSGLVKNFRSPGYDPKEAMVPHGMSVILNAPSVFRFTAPACPERHLEAAEKLGSDVRGAGARDAGEVLSERIIELMQATGIPNGLAAVGYGKPDLEALTDGSFPQKGLINNAPRSTSREELRELYEKALTYW